MLGSTHVTTGLAVGMATAPLLDLTRAWEVPAWVLACGGTAMVADLDQPGSTAARAWGPITGALAHFVAALAGGHRHRTHDLLVGPPVTAVCFWAATLTRPTAVLALALGIGLGLRALNVVWAHRAARSAVLNALLSVGVAVALTDSGVTLPWLPVAAALGVVVHIAGDALTPSLVPAPGATLVGSSRRVGIPIMRTGNRGSENLVAGLCVAVTVALGVLWGHLGLIDYSSMPAAALQVASGLVPACRGRALVPGVVSGLAPVAAPDRVRTPVGLGAVESVAAAAPLPVLTSVLVLGLVLVLVRRRQCPLTWLWCSR